jgi:hypothetical protein
MFSSWSLRRTADGRSDKAYLPHMMDELLCVDVRREVLMGREGPSDGVDDVFRNRLLSFEAVALRLIKLPVS